MLLLAGLLTYHFHFGNRIACVLEWLTTVLATGYRITGSIAVVGINLKYIPLLINSFLHLFFSLSIVKHWSLFWILRLLIIWLGPTVNTRVAFIFLHQWRNTIMVLIFSMLTCGCWRIHLLGDLWQISGVVATSDIYIIHILLYLLCMYCCRYLFVEV